MMRVTYDKDADAIYIYFDSKAEAQVITDGEWPFHVDIDAKGNILGIEVLEARSIFSKEFLDKADIIG